MSNQRYEPVIGLEVHVELNTKTKMFCRCSADYFGKEPNTHTCPICLGLPGALPYINKEAIDKCIQIGLALNCKISEKSLFERKNYFYPDLPKGYQISQYRWPLCVNGQLTLDNRRGLFSDENGQLIRINRVHQEEDTGKLTHLPAGRQGLGNETHIDFNRSGVPLVEIVTEPDFRNVEEVRDYAKKLQQLFRYLRVSNADMEKGDMRLEANVSVRKSNVHPRGGARNLPNYRVELKNINSFRFMIAAVEYEIRRQIESLEKGEKLTQETRGWDEDKKCTYLQRSKEEAHDYRYFPEPDLPELKIKEARIKNLESSLPELPWKKSQRYEKEFKIKKADADIIAGNIYYARLFEAEVRFGIQKGVSPQEIANIFINRAKVNADLFNKEIPDMKIVEEIVQQRLSIISDESELEKLAKQALDENPSFVETYKKGKTTVIMALVGAVMKKTSGKADAQKVRQILEELLQKP